MNDVSCENAREKNESEKCYVFCFVLRISYVFFHLYMEGNRENMASAFGHFRLNQLIYIFLFSELPLHSVSSCINLRKFSVQNRRSTRPQITFAILYSTIEKLHIVNGSISYSFVLHRKSIKLHFQN